MLRVDTVPLLLRPLFLLYGYGLGILLRLMAVIIHYTCSIKFEGTDFKEHPNYILCIWHESLIPFFSVFLNMKNQAWMNHPAWYMKPVHVALRMAGVKHLCLGSTGNSGKEALAGVISFLKQGYSTTIASDGPAGPAYDLKPGVLLMSRDSGAPVIPIRFEMNRYFRLGKWDRKFVPRPFSTICVQAGAPVFVTSENMEHSAAVIKAWLNFGNEAAFDNPDEQGEVCRNDI